MALGEAQKPPEESHLRQMLACDQKGFRPISSLAPQMAAPRPSRLVRLTLRLIAHHLSADIRIPVVGHPCLLYTSPLHPLRIHELQAGRDRHLPNDQPRLLRHRVLLLLCQENQAPHEDPTPQVLETPKPIHQPMTLLLREVLHLSGVMQPVVYKAQQTSLIVYLKGQI